MIIMYVLPTLALFSSSLDLTAEFRGAILLGFIDLLVENKLLVESI